MQNIRFKAPAILGFGKRKIKISGLADEITLEKRPKPQVALVSDGGFSFATNDTNPLFKLAASLGRYAKGQGVRIRIQKNIPPKMGLGSTHSAITSLAPALNQLWELCFSEDRLEKEIKKSDHAMTSLPPVRQAFSGYVVIAIPRLIRIDRDWIKFTKKPTDAAAVAVAAADSVAFNHFPDLKMIRDALRQVGWEDIGMSGFGPAIVGWSEKRIPKSKLPESILSKLDFLWIGK